MSHTSTCMHHAVVVLSSCVAWSEAWNDEPKMVNRWNTLVLPDTSR